MSQTTYEPRVILEHAGRLNRRADSMGITSAGIGAVIGGFLGAVPLTSLGSSWPIPSQFGFGTLLVGVLVGALAGYVIGDARAFGYRLQAQSSLCQLQLEQNTATLLANSYPGNSHTEVRYTPEPEPAVVPPFEYAEPEPAPFVEAPFTYPDPEPTPLVEARFEYPEPEPAPFVETPVAERYEPEPRPEPAPLVEVPRPDYFEPEHEPAPPTPLPLPAAAAPEPQPAVNVQAAPAPWSAEAPLPDLDSLSLEQIAQLAKSGLI